MEDSTKAPSAVAEDFPRYQAAILDAVPSHAAFLDATGVILAVNRAWTDQARADPLLTPGLAVGGNYLDACDAATGPSAEGASTVASGLREVLRGERDRFVLEYPVLGSSGKSWVRLIVTPDGSGPSRGAVVLHVDATEQRLGEEALIRRESHFRALVENSSDGLALLAADGALLFHNPAVQPILGFGRAELKGRAFWDLFHEDDRDAAAQSLATAMARPGVPSEVMVRARHKDGSWRTLECVTVNRLADPAIGAVVCNYRDVTAKREADRALAESERQLRAIFELTLDAIFIADDEGRYVDANPAACDLMGLTLAEIRTHGVADFAVPGSDPEERWAALLRAGRTKGEHELCLPSGLVRHLEFSATADVLPGRHMIVARDMTEQKRSQEALGRSEERFESIFRSSPVGVVLSDMECRLIDANEPVAEFLGYPRDELIGRTSYELSLWVDRQQHESVLGEVRAGRKVRNLEARFRAKSGDIRDGLVSVDNLSLAGGEKALLMVVADITERKQLEEKLRQSQKMEAVGRLAGGVAHDFNNLLGVITGYADLLGRGLDASDVRLRRVEKIQGAVERAAALVRQLVTFSRPQVLEPRTLDLNQILAAIEPMLRRVIGEDVELVVAFGKDLLSVRADAGQIEQVVVSLAANARDAMPQGGRIVLETANVTLEGANAAGAAPGRYVVLSMSDTGRGMDAEVRKHIFEPFYTTKPTGQGTGLGLATVYGIVQQSGGHIGVESEPGSGSTFKVYLPGVEVVDTTRAAQAEPRLVSGRGETILMVEDEPALRDMNQEILAECGYVVLTADAGAQALEVAASHVGTIDLLLTDVIMPGMSGSELSRRLLVVRPATRVLYMSGYTGDALLQRGIAEAGAALLQKPFTAPTLARRVRETLDAG